MFPGTICTVQLNEENLGVIKCTDLELDKEIKSATGSHFFQLRLFSKVKSFFIA